MNKIVRYIIRRKTDGFYYKNNQAIYPEIESYWAKDINKSRLWSYKPDESYWSRENWGHDFEILTVTLTP